MERRENGRAIRGSSEWPPPSEACPASPPPGLPQFWMPGLAAYRRLENLRSPFGHSDIAQSGLYVHDKITSSSAEAAPGDAWSYQQDQRLSRRVHQDSGAHSLGSHNTTPAADPGFDDTLTAVGPAALQSMAQTSQAYDAHPASALAPSKLESAQRLQPPWMTYDLQGGEQRLPNRRASSSAPAAKRKRQRCSSRLLSQPPRRSR